jgi:hypothetical protein
MSEITLGCEMSHISRQDAVIQSACGTREAA